MKQWQPIPVPSGVQPGNISTKNIFNILNPKQTPKVYIETGTHKGKGVDWALNHFEKVHSIEISKEFYYPCLERYKYQPRVQLHFGDSRKKLLEVLKIVNKTCFIFLDAHGDINDQGPNPLYEEIEAIRNNSISNHIILIDDLRRIGDPSDPCWSKISIEELKTQLQSLNNKYEILEYSDSLLAILPEDKLEKII